MIARRLHESMSGVQMTGADGNRRDTPARSVVLAGRNNPPVATGTSGPLTYIDAIGEQGCKVTVATVQHCECCA